MADIVTRDVGPTAKNDNLTNEELDQNFINLNNEIQALREQVESDLSFAAFLSAQM